MTLTYQQCTLYSSHWFKALILPGTSSEQGPRWPRLPGTRFLPSTVPGAGHRDGPAFTVLAAVRVEWVHLCQIQKRAKTPSSCFRLKIQLHVFFLHSSPANEALWPRCWFYPLTTHKSRNNAQVLVCDSESQKTLASSLFLTSIFMCSRPHPQEWKQHQLKFKWCKHEWLCVKNRNLLRFLSMPFQSAK